ncbi:MAG: DUF6273 domain-containing protein, partial [Bacillota bacterium]|nr:DUF6273 domain-containing protein [Bacillota bacterium]
MGNKTDGNNTYRLFLSNHVLADVQFNPESAGNAWQGSAAQSWCQNFYANAFSAAEKAVIVPTTKTDAAFTSPNGRQFGESSLTNEQVFFLSAEEAHVENPFESDDDRIAKNLSNQPVSWWLRSPSDPDQVGIVDMNGGAGSSDYTSSLGARPAFNLNLNSILYVSDAEGGKISGPLGAKALTAVSQEQPNDWKLTLKDDSREDFSVTVTSLSSSQITFNYEGATRYDADTAPNEYISAILTRRETGGLMPSVRYYGRIAQPSSSSGTLTIDFSGIPIEDMGVISIFSEQYNGDKQTDLASDPERVYLLYSISNDLTNISSNNEATERHFTETTDYSATLSADSGYVLPEKISVSVGGTELTEGIEYNYDSSSGALLIPAASINGNVQIEAVAVAADPTETSPTTDETTDATSDEPTFPTITTDPTTVDPTSPTTIDPTTFNPTTFDPTTFYPTTTDPTTTSLTTTDPTTTDLTTTDPTTATPTTTDPTTATSTTTDPTTTSLTTTDPTTATPTTTDPTTTDPTTTDPTTATPTTTDPTTATPTTTDPTTATPTTTDPTTATPTTTDPTTASPTTTDPTTATPTTTDPTTASPTTTEPTTAIPTTTEPTTTEPTTATPTTTDPTTTDPTTASPTTAAPTTATP